MSRPPAERKIVLAVLAAVLAVLLAGPGPAGAGELTVTVPERAEVQGERVTLADLALITGPDGALKNDLGAVFITQAPPPGRSVKLQEEYLRFRLRSSGLPLEAVAWDLPETVVVVREAQGLEAGFVRRVFEEYLAEHAPYRDRDWELVSLRTGRLPRLPAGELTYRLLPDPSPNPTRLRLNIYLSVNGREVGRIRAAGRINLFSRVVVAARLLPKDRVIQEGDLKVARVNIARLKHGALTDPSGLKGLSCRRTLQPGQPVQASDVVKHPVIRRGDTVTIVAQSGSLRVTTLGRAKEEGTVGENISVVNLGSKKRIVAQVVGPNEVRVNFQTSRR